MIKPRLEQLLWAGVAAAALAGLTSCSAGVTSPAQPARQHWPPPVLAGAGHDWQALAQWEDGDIDLARAASDNANSLVLERFVHEVLVFGHPSGIDLVEELYSDSQTLIIAEDSAAASLRAASLAVAQRAPMITYSDEIRPQLLALIDQLSVRRVLLVGSVPFARIGTDSLAAGEELGQVRIMRDPGTQAAMGTITAFQFTNQLVAAPEHSVAAVARLDPHAKIELKAAWEPLEIAPHHRVGALPAQSRRDSGMSPVFVATADSPIAAVATARAWGGEVRVMPTADPRESKAALAMVAGLEGGKLVALGEAFGSPSLLTDRIWQGWHTYAPDGR